MHYDLIIIGGGLVGAGLACALRHTSLRIALIDARLPTHEDPRLFALTSGSCQLLANLGWWSQLAEQAAPIHQVHVSYQGHFGAVRLRREEVQLSALGYVVPARVIEVVAHDALMHSPHVTLYRPARLIQLTQQNEMATVTLETKEGKNHLTARLIIGADGTDSTVRHQAKIGTRLVETGQQAIVTTTQLKRSHDQVAYERFYAKGTIALLPLPGNECATIWTADSETISQLMALSEEAFLQALQKQFGYRLGRLQSIRRRHMFPLRVVRADKAVAGCVCLLGNALHTVHPVAAQGFNLALYEVAWLVELIDRHLTEDGLQVAALLQAFASQIQKQQVMSVTLSHQLSQLFLKEAGLMQVVLQLGMISLDRLTPIKKRFIETIMGSRGRVPRLLLSVKE